ncbi:Hypothetical predicted protein [Pelobates cultripes]|uniref:Uncharacterized protein n=1 Tax=Pelobates cultripes TaxID=61616 RepID=A0AAD1RU49_PELCU|nr:Hypothetical predicted protein [Pelobates cultripes]
MTLSFYADLSGETLQWRRSLQSFTTLLKENNIGYRWHSPTALQDLHNNTAHSIADLRGNSALLQPIGLPGDTLVPNKHPGNNPTKHRWDPAKITPFVPQGGKPDAYAIAIT